MDIDRKFVIDARSRNSGKVYTENDAVVFLARDPALPATLETYRKECERLGAKQPQLAAAQALQARVEKFQRDNPGEVKVADVEEGAECERLCAAMPEEI